MNYSYLVGVLLLASCGQQQDVSFFKSHPERIQKKLVDCRINGKLNVNDKACLAAYLAQEVKSVDYFVQDQTQRFILFSDCKDFPGLLGETPNCKNVIQAELISSANNKKTLNFSAP